MANKCTVKCLTLHMANGAFWKPWPSEPPRACGATVSSGPIDHNTPYSLTELPCPAAFDLHVLPLDENNPKIQGHSLNLESSSIGAPFPVNQGTIKLCSLERKKSLGESLQVGGSGAMFPQPTSGYRVPYSQPERNFYSPERELLEFDLPFLLGMRRPLTCER
ncbi:uncharacterized protein LOC108672383 [Hyalella azteca]|uniref:Uncharacterized protein LOC108672383 n=1 Tax=Hyalella azteca TaxID=294128 RepID=A0A8B7NR13_HYAAZ|nr:uncharacterized protein LOC108672383 [Hyalella azteca]XP_018015516.1 uncharacterized protein LOC108672383 [Hyalella azteca]XP_047736142.1 uncharacterized protein LOC108672383 [Hyalella azteca]